MSYAEYKFGKAMRALSEFNGRHRQWLASAEVYLLSRLQEDDVPMEVRLNFSQFQQALARLQAKYDKQSLQAVADAADENEIREITERFVKLCAAMQH